MATDWRYALLWHLWQKPCLRWQRWAIQDLQPFVDTLNVFMWERNGDLPIDLLMDNFGIIIKLGESDD